MKRIAILTAGGDTPALNATIYGAVERANQHKIEVLGFIRGFAGLLDTRAPHVRLNPLYQTIPELDPCHGGTLLGASRTYIDPENREQVDAVKRTFHALNIDGLLCIGGDGTLNGMQPLSEAFPCVLAPKTIDNDLGLNYIDEPNEWAIDDVGGQRCYRKLPGRAEIGLEDMINYATPGYATAVFVVAQGVERIRTTAESHRRIAIIEVMGRESGYIALGSAYGQPDIILIPEVPLDLDALESRLRELYSLQKHAVIIVGEGVAGPDGKPLGAISTSSVDPAGNVMFSGTAEHLKRIMAKRLGDDFFRTHRRHESAESVFFTRKVGHTQRGGRPIRFDRFYAAQLGGKAVDLLEQGQNNAVATLQWCEARGFTLDSIDANHLRDQWRIIHPRMLHTSLYDAHRFQPSKLGCQYLMPIFDNAIGSEDVEFIRDELFSAGSLLNRYQSKNVALQKRVQTLHD
jgi:6-phosphofructokinase 1